MLASGDSVDRFVVLEAIGAGGQATVWRARDQPSGAIVALKLVPLTGDERADTRARREASVLASLVHPSLVRCHRYFEDARRRVLGMVLEWVDGTTLDRARADPRWTAAHTHAALAHVAGALAKLHEAGVVHRDIKGRNVLVSDAFFETPLDPASIKLADLGIATGVGNPAAITSVGFIVGSPRFLPPETLRERGTKDARPTRDVFALGVMGWLLVREAHPTGLPPGASLEELGAVYDEHREAETLWLPDDEADDAIVRALRRCLRLDPDKRPADARAVLELLPALPRHSVPKTAPPLVPTLEVRAQRTLLGEGEEERGAGASGGAGAGAGAGPGAGARPGARAAWGIGAGWSTRLVAGTAAMAFVLGCSAVYVVYASQRALTRSSEERVDEDSVGTVPLPKRATSGPVKLTFSASPPSGATGGYRPAPECAPRWPAPPTREELEKAAEDKTPLRRGAFKDDACESEVVNSSSHCALTHRDGRWLRLRFFLKDGTRLSAVSSDVAPIAEPWAEGVDLYVPLPPSRAIVSITAEGAWSDAHTLVLDPAASKPMAFVETGPCKE